MHPPRTTQQQHRVQVNQWHTEDGGPPPTRVALELSVNSPERSGHGDDMTGVQRSHATWKECEIQRASRPLASLSLVVEL
jgi:hypothetical protein